MRKLLALGALTATALAAVVATNALARDGGPHGRFAAFLTGYEEIIPANVNVANPAASTPEGGAVSTTGLGRFEARLRNDPLRLEYRLTWRNLEGTDVSASHIHFGQRHTVGGVSAFLCGGGGKPACPDGGSGTVEGTINIADVVGPTAQGIEAGKLDELLRAMRVGATYVNLHTNKWPSGEIRGQVVRGGFHDKGDKKRRD